MSRADFSHSVGPSGSSDSDGVPDGVTEPDGVPDGVVLPEGVEDASAAGSPVSPAVSSVSSAGEEEALSAGAVVVTSADGVSV